MSKNAGSDAARTRNVDAVQVRGGGWVAELRVVGGTDAPDPDLDVAALVADLEAGCQLAQVGNVLNALHLQVFALEVVGGYTQILQILLAPFDGDDHFLDSATRPLLRVFCFYFLAGAGKRRDAEGDRGQNREDVLGVGRCLLHCVFHVVSPVLC